MINQAAMDQFNQVGVRSRVDSASPHALVAMLFDGLLERLARARGHIERGQLQQQGEMISKSIGIIDGLRASLEYSRSPELGQRLRDLYDYMEVQLAQANSKSDTAAVDGVIDLVREIKAGWDGIAPQASNHAS